MCRYSQSTYKRHLACFDCRKVFRSAAPGEEADHKARQPWELYLKRLYRRPRRRREPVERPPFRTVLCPDCRREMVDVGLDFKAPRRADRKQWEKARQLVVAGVRFHSCGCNGPGPRPATLREVPAFLEARRLQTEAAVLLEQFKARA